MKQVFDSYPDGDGNIIIITARFDEDGNRVIEKNHITLSRAKQIYLTLGESIGVLAETETKAPTCTTCGSADTYTTTAYHCRRCATTTEM